MFPWLTLLLAQINSSEVNEAVAALQCDRAMNQSERKAKTGNPQTARKKNAWPQIMVSNLPD